MNTPRNYITALPVYHFATDKLDAYLPFTGKRIFIRYISKTPKGYGRWLLTVTLKIDDQQGDLRALTQNSQLIDEWYTEDHQVNDATMLRVAELVFAANEDKLEDFQ